MPAKGQSDNAVEATAIEGPGLGEKLLVKMAGLATLNTDETSLDDVERILAAETEADMWDADELAGYGARDLVGCHLTIYGFDIKWGRGDEDIKSPFVDPASKRQMYVWVLAARINNLQDKRELRLPEPGTQFRFNTSAPRVVGKLFWMLEHGWFDPGHAPVKLRIEGKDIGGGREVVKLKPIVPVGFESTTETPF